MRLMLYSLLNKSGKSELTINLTGKLIDFENHHSDTLEIKLETGAVYLRKKEYQNTGKVFDNGSVFFIVATKWMSPKYAKEVLLNHALKKVDSRLDNLNTFKKRLEAELAA